MLALRAWMERAPRPNKRPRRKPGDRGSYVVGEHASERLLERGIMEWQVIAGMPDAKLLAERRTARPNPAVEVRVPLPDGRDCTAIWSHLRQTGVAKLVTVYLLNDNDPSEEG